MFAGAGFERGDADGFFDAEGAGAAAPQGGEVGAAAEQLADVVGVGADVEAFAAADAKVDFGAGEVDAQDVVLADGDVPRLPLDALPFAGEFVAGDAVDFDGGVHGRGLVEAAAVVLEGGADGVGAELVGGAGGDDLAVGVLAVGFDAEFHGGQVFFVIAHEAVLQFGGFADDDHEQAGGHGVEGAAVPDFAGVEDAAAEGDGVVRGEAGVFVDEEDAAGGVGCFRGAHGDGEGWRGGMPTAGEPRAARALRWCGFGRRGGAVRREVCGRSLVGGEGAQDAAQFVEDAFAAVGEAAAHADAGGHAVAAAVEAAGDVGDVDAGVFGAQGDADAAVFEVFKDGAGFDAADDADDVDEVFGVFKVDAEALFGAGFHGVV